MTLAECQQNIWHCDSEQKTSQFTAKKEKSSVYFGIKMSNGIFTLWKSIFTLFSRRKFSCVELAFDVAPYLHFSGTQVPTRFQWDFLWWSEGVIRYILAKDKIQYLIVILNKKEIPPDKIYHIQHDSCSWIYDIYMKMYFKQYLNPPPLFQMDCPWRHFLQRHCLTSMVVYSNLTMDNQEEILDALNSE